MSAALECKNCTKRFLGCHSTCESYLAWKAERVEATKKERDEKAADRALAEGRARCGGKIKKYSERRSTFGQNQD